MNYHQSRSNEDQKEGQGPLQKNEFLQASSKKKTFASRKVHSIIKYGVQMGHLRGTFVIPVENLDGPIPTEILVKGNYTN